MAHTYSAAARREMRNEAQAFINAHPGKFPGRSITAFVHQHGDVIRLEVKFTSPRRSQMRTNEVLVPCSLFDTFEGNDYGLLVRMVKEGAPLPATFHRSR